MNYRKRSHANADWRSRRAKARRIEAMLTSCLGDLWEKDILDIGTGAGIIASHFASLARSVVSVDVVDERVIRDFEFREVSSELLPCTPESIDVVISNQVIEHVDDQLTHLQEIRRVLRPGGICYLSTPNRFAIMEPHFNLPFLSWLPDKARTKYVRLTGRGTHYDVQPLTYRQLRELAVRAGLGFHDIANDIVKAVLYERIRIRRIPMMSFLTPFYPTFVVLLDRSH